MARHRIAERKAKWPLRPQCLSICATWHFEKWCRTRRFHLLIGLWTLGILIPWKWILTEVSRLRSGRLSQKKKKTTQQLRETDPWVLVMSINRTRWLDKLRPAGASSGGWTEGPMAPVETTDAATFDQRCPFKHRTGWRHNHSNSKIVCRLAHGQADLLSISNCHPCAGAMLSSHSILQATRFVNVILEQESISSSQGEEKKKTNLCVLSLCKPYLCIVQKNHLRSCDGQHFMENVTASQQLCHLAQ